jgi:hypothetical protein
MDSHVRNDFSTLEKPIPTWRTTFLLWKSGFPRKNRKFQSGKMDSHGRIDFFTLENSSATGELTFFPSQEGRFSDRPYKPYLKGVAETEHQKSKPHQLMLKRKSKFRSMSHPPPRANSESSVDSVANSRVLDRQPAVFPIDT